jgi:hypothetical protein
MCLRVSYKKTNMKKLLKNVVGSGVESIRQEVGIRTQKSRISNTGLEGVTVNAKVASVLLGSIPASSETVESEGRHIKQC